MTGARKLGRPQSPETKKKISDAIKAIWKKKLAVKKQGRKKQNKIIAQRKRPRGTVRCDICKDLFSVNNYSFEDHLPCPGMFFDEKGNKVQKSSFEV